MQNGTLCGQSYTKMLSAGHINIVADIKLRVWQKYIYFFIFRPSKEEGKDQDSIQSSNTGHHKGK